jgi:hypothetical protein
MCNKYQKQQLAANDNQPSLFSTFGPSVTKYGPKNEEQVKITKSLVENLVIGCGVPLSTVDNKKFAAFMADVNPRYCLPYQNHWTSKLIPVACEKPIENLQSHVNDALYVALTVDIWTDR